MHKFFILFFFVNIWACTAPNSSDVLDDAPEASLVVPEKIMTPEERDLENKIANRSILQGVIDNSENYQKTEYFYECNNNSGGLLTLIKDGDTIKGIRFAASKEGLNEFVSFYYRKGDLVFVVHEKGEWVADQEKDTQTVFYLDDGKVFHCLRKMASGEKEQIEQLIQEAEFTPISSDSLLFQEIKNYEDLFINKVTQKNIAEHFCH